MSKIRLETFSDGVIAILITIMVLELKAPEGSSWASLGQTAPLLLRYALSFVYLGIYWNNHHHMLHATTRVNGGILWANLHLLFWLSLLPFATNWAGEAPGAAVPAAFYGIVLILAALAYTLLQNALIREHGPNSVLATAIGSDSKGRMSLGLYAAAIGLGFVSPWISEALYAIVAGIWLVPDRRIESRISHSE